MTKLRYFDLLAGTARLPGSYALLSKLLARVHARNMSVGGERLAVAPLGLPSAGKAWAGDRSAGLRVFGDRDALEDFLDDHDLVSMVAEGYILRPRVREVPDTTGRVAWVRDRSQERMFAGLHDRKARREVTRTIEGKTRLQPATTAQRMSAVNGSPESTGVHYVAVSSTSTGQRFNIWFRRAGLGANVDGGVGEVGTYGFSGANKPVTLPDF